MASEFYLPPALRVCFFFGSLCEYVRRNFRIEIATFLSLAILENESFTYSKGDQVKKDFWYFWSQKYGRNNLRMRWEFGCYRDVSTSFHSARHDRADPSYRRDDKRRILWNCHTVKLLSLHSHHPLLIPRFSYNCRRGFFHEYESLFREECLKFSKFLLDDFFVFWYSCFAQLVSADLKLRLEKEEYICCSISKSRKLWHNLSKWDEWDIAYNDIIYLRWEFTDICLLITRHWRIASDCLMKLECPDIHGIDMICSSL